MKNSLFIFIFLILEAFFFKAHADDREYFKVCPVKTGDQNGNGSVQYEEYSFLTLSQEKVEVKACFVSTDRKTYLSFKFQNLPIRFLTDLELDFPLKSKFSKDGKYFVSHEMMGGKVSIYSIQKLRSEIESALKIYQNHKTKPSEFWEHNPEAEYSFFPIYSLKEEFEKLLESDQLPQVFSFDEWKAISGLGLGSAWGFGAMWKSNNILVGYKGCCDETPQPFLIDLEKDLFYPLTPFRLQVGSFQDRKLAEQLVNLLEKEELQTIFDDHDLPYRVFLDGFISKVEAEQMGKELIQKKVVKDFIIVESKSYFK